MLQCSLTHEWRHPSSWPQPLLTQLSFILRLFIPFARLDCWSKSIGRFKVITLQFVRFEQLICILLLCSPSPSFVFSPFLGEPVKMGQWGVYLSIDFCLCTFGLSFLSLCLCMVLSTQVPVHLFVSPSIFVFFSWTAVKIFPAGQHCISLSFGVAVRFCCREARPYPWETHDFFFLFPWAVLVLCLACL